MNQTCTLSPNPLDQVVGYDPNSSMSQGLGQAPMANNTAKPIYQQQSMRDNSLMIDDLGYSGSNNNYNQNNLNVSQSTNLLSGLGGPGQSQ